MVEVAVEESGDRLIVRLDPKGPIEVDDLTGSFAALARIYERHYRTGGEPPPKLYITKLESGSIIAEIAPFVYLLGAMIQAMDSSLIVGEFAKRLAKGIKAFSGSESIPDQEKAEIRSDAADIREFVRPLAGREGASLGLKHARFTREEGETRTVAEYVFDEAEINRATINIENIMDSTDEKSLPLQITSIKQLNEVMLFFDQASRSPGKEKGRTGDRGIIPDVSDKALPVYFRKSANNLKDQMVKGDINPLTDTAFVVDVVVQQPHGEPKAYLITDVHEVIPIDPPD
ncbi:MAG: hypothetical protein CMM50_15380 [Rhodospirillaceae bacterium]|nr:hypothetical protein [Rhodospirillaceae bacterium]|tara:strand:+ start:685 stop:1548 length:864 start_codon:yes stop_codon:yes gene_type:complete